MSKFLNFRTDPFGMGAAALAAFEAFCVGTRNTGRTTRLIAEAQPGDFIVTYPSQHVTFLSRELVKQGKGSVRVVSINPDSANIEDVLRSYLEGRKRPARIFFSDDFTEKFTRNQLVRATTLLGNIQQQMSDDNDAFRYYHDQIFQDRYARV